MHFKTLQKFKIMFHVFLIHGNLQIIYYTFLLFLNYFHITSSNSLVISLVLLYPKKILLTVYIIFSTIYLFFFLLLNFTLRNKINRSFYYYQ